MRSFSLIFVSGNSFRIWSTGTYNILGYIIRKGMKFARFLVRVSVAFVLIGGMAIAAIYWALISRGHSPTEAIRLTITVAALAAFAAYMHGKLIRHS